MCMDESSPVCPMWPLEHVLPFLFVLFVLSSIFTLSPSPPSFCSPACPEALQLETVLLLSNTLLKMGDHPMRMKPEWSSHRTIPEISLNLHLRFHLPQGDTGMEGGICATGCEKSVERWQKRAVIRVSDFPCWTCGGKRGRWLDVALATAGVQTVCVWVFAHAHKHIKCPLLVWSFLWLSQHLLSFHLALRKQRETLSLAEAMLNY